MPEQQTLVTGRVLFDEAPAEAEGATLFVRLEDVSFADEAADTVAESTPTLDRAAVRNAELPFALQGDPDALAPTGRYEVSVHVDVDGDGEVSRGDYLNTTAAPIGEVPAEVDVTVERI